MADTAIDFAHLQECVDPHCWYCRDEAQPVSKTDPEILRFLSSLVAVPPLAELELKAA